MPKPKTRIRKRFESNAKDRIDMQCPWCGKEIPLGEYSDHLQYCKKYPPHYEAIKEQARIGDEKKDLEKEIQKNYVKMEAKKIRKFVWGLSAGRFQPFVLVHGYEPTLGKVETHKSHWGSPEINEILANEEPTRRQELEQKWVSFSNIIERGGYELVKRTREGEVIEPIYPLLEETAKAIEESLRKRFGDDPDVETSEYRTR